jgi:hypothetical protein
MHDACFKIQKKTLDVVLSFVFVSGHPPIAILSVYIYIYIYIYIYNQLLHVM